MTYAWELLHKAVSAIVCFFMVCSASTVSFEPTEPDILFGAAPTALRQEINITDAYFYTPASTYATSSAIVQVASTSYSGATAYFEVVASSTSGTTGTIQLVNATSGAVVKSITLDQGNVYTRYRSTSFTMPDDAKEYKVVLGNEAMGKGLLASRIVILQSGTITNTETQIEIGSATTSASNTNTLPLTEPKYWLYTSANWDASPTFYAEVTYKNNPTASSTIYGVSATSTPTFHTYIGSTGVGYVVAEGWGGGGGGDGATSAATIGGGGGGGGTYARATTTVAAGSTNKIGVGQGGAEGVARADTASSTLTTASGLVLAAQGGEGATTATGAATSTLAASVGTVIYAGGAGGDGQTDTDTGGGGGGAAGPDGYGIQGHVAASNGPGGAGGNGDLNLGGAGGAGGSSDAAPDTCDAELGLPGGNNPKGAGGGGGADGDVSSTCSGGNGGRPGGGGGGSDEGATGIGGPGQVKITEYIGTVGVAIEEDDGAFGTWTFKQQIITRGQAATTSQRVRVSFTPTDAKHYRIVASTTNSTAPYDIYNAKIVVDQNATVAGAIQDSYSESNQDVSHPMFTGSLVDAVGQSFTGTGGTLGKTKFYLKKTGTPTGNAVSKIYAHSGIFGTNSIPTGAALATSDNLDVSTLTTSYVLKTLTFSGGNQIVLTNGTNYVVTIEYQGGDGSNHTDSGSDVISPTHAGNESTLDGSTWSVQSNDTIFYVQNVDINNGIPSLLEPQYLLAPFKLAAGTSLQNYLTSWTSTEWAGSTNAYYHEVSAADNDTSVVEVDTAAGVQVSNSVVTSPDNRGRSASMCMPANGDLDVKATTNSGNIYASRIIVQVGGTACVATTAQPKAIINTRLITPFGGTSP